MKIKKDTKSKNMGMFISKMNNLSNERLVIMSLSLLLIATFLFSGWLYFYFVPIRVQESIVANKDGFKLLNPIRKIVDKKDLIVNFQSLRTFLNTYEADPNISIYFEYLNTGSNISINKDAEFWPASMLKVPVAMAVAKKIEKGEWKWDNKLVLMASDKDEKFGNLYLEKTGTTFTIEDLVRRALVDSDNTANFILVRNLEVSEITDAYDHMGLSDFFSSAGNIGAKKYSVIFRALYNASYLSEESSQKILNYLSQTEFKNYIQSPLPPEVIFAHKIGTGVDKETYLDSGIVYLKNRPYMLTVMIKTKDEKSAIDSMEKISESVYRYVVDFEEVE